MPAAVMPAAVMPAAVMPAAVMRGLRATAEATQILECSRSAGCPECPDIPLITVYS